MLVFTAVAMKRQTELRWIQFPLTIFEKSLQFKWSLSELIQHMVG